MKCNNFALPISNPPGAIMKISVLRIGHRIFRDQRITTHCALASRAFGADEIIVVGDKDDKLIEHVSSTVKRWGGKFKISHAESWRYILKQAKKEKTKLVHLTVYGELLKTKISTIRKDDKIMIIIGSSKVPGEIYQVADYNVSISNQPHSEVAALAVFLHEYFEGKELDKKFSKAKIKVVPQAKGKRVIGLR